MKQYLLELSLAVATYFACSDTLAQTRLEPDQNPNFEVSRAKYMKIADSLNAWHSTTIQDQYKAADWLADKRQSRMDRRSFHRQLRLERARWSNYYGHPYYYPRSYYNYHRHYYRGGRSYNAWRGFNFWWP